MKKLIYNTVFIIYLIVAIFVTVCLLSYNDYKVTQFGSTSLVIISDNKMKPDFNKGDLVIADNSNEIKAGDKILYYDTYNQQILVKLGTVEEVEKTSDLEVSYIIDGGEYKISNEYVIGSTSTANIMPNAGTILGIIESRWGFLFLIVLPALLAFVNQIIVVVTGIKEAKEEVKKEAKEEKENVQS